LRERISNRDPNSLSVAHHFKIAEAKDAEALTRKKCVTPSIAFLVSRLEMLSTINLDDHL
jgi:hypothetical protein